MPLTKEQLLIPRVMCTGEEKGKRLYPHSEVYVGEILTLDPSGYTYASDTGKWVGKAQVAEFPHLFRPMPWWEGRKPEDMPEFVKAIKTGKVHKALWDRFNEKGVIHWSVIIETRGIPHNPEGFEPATEQEYNEYQKQKEGMVMCKEKGCDKPATKDYNGHGYFVCDAHYESLSNYFDEEYK